MNLVRRPANLDLLLDRRAVFYVRKNIPIPVNAALLSMEAVGVRISPEKPTVPGNAPEK